MMGLGVGVLSGYDRELTLSFESVFVKRVHAKKQKVKKKLRGTGIQIILPGLDSLD